MSKLGKIYADATIDGGSLQPHYGPDDPVTGSVNLTYEPATNILKRKTDTADFFGPLKIKLMVHGMVNIKARYERELPTHHRADLFHQEVVVHNGPFKAKSDDTYQFPWSFTFPEDARPIKSQVWIPTPTASLPPSFGMHFITSPDIVDVRVTYVLELVVSAGGINVKTSVPREDFWPAIKYDLPRPARNSPSTFTDRTNIQSDQLRSIERRSSGMKNKFMVPAYSSNIPRLSLDITCTEHRHIYPGQMLTYRIKLSRDEDNSTAVAIPRASLEQMKVELISTTTVNTSQRMIGSSQCIDQRTLQKFACHRALPAEFLQSRHYTVDVVLDYVADVMSSFAHREVSRSYKLRVEAQINVGNKLVRVNRDCPVTVIPPPLDGAMVDTGPLDAQIPSQLTVEDDLPPPTYDEVTANGAGSSHPDSK